MADQTAIQWTDATWNPVTGCTRVSPGCANCYIERTPPFRMAGRRFARVHDVARGRPEDFFRVNESSTGVQLHPDRLEQPLHWRKPRRVFVCSLADLFHDDVPDAYIDDVFAAMLAAPQHTFQVLTKRPERARDWFESAVSSFDTRTRVWTIAAHMLGATRERGGWPAETWPLPNVWLGVSIENARFTWRAAVLREIPAAVRFISAEPLLGSLFSVRSSGRFRPDGEDSGGDSEGDHAKGIAGSGADHQNAGAGQVGLATPAPGLARPLDLTGIDWVIAGAESGRRARPMDVDHVREIRDACVASGAAFFFKQDAIKGQKIGLPELDGRQWMEFPHA